ncbi:MAG: hypothetical protein JST00_09575 [Deltaproteobacteria bacterium]|nr:hypothetical protein [Deltaproteobacteria bacterium]
MRSLLSATLACVVLLGCKGSSPSGGAAGNGAGVPSSAVMQWPDGSPGAELVTEGGKRIAVPEADLARGASPAIVKDDTGKRLAYPTTDGKVRLVYLLPDENPWIGPATTAPLDFRSAPDLVHALAEGASRAKEWDDAYGKLSDPQKEDVKKALATYLEKGKPAAPLVRTVTLVPLRDPAKKDVLVARVKELAQSMTAPRANAVLLRALATLDKAEAGAIGCEILNKAPLDAANAKGTPEEIDRQGRESLVESSLVALAQAGAACPKAEAIVLDEPCASWLRCGADGPVSPAQLSRQDEPLCTRADVEKAVAVELARTPDDVLSVGKGVRSELFALGVLLVGDKVPAKLTNTHARRRYEIVQKASPECDAAAIGAPCHCDEAMLRDQTCRHPESQQVSVGLCKFDIDDKAKKITNVVMTPPP